jgi:Sec-independent protein translocase protein TatA
MIGLQPIHILLIALVALLLFAPGRLPLVIRGAKKMVSEFKREVAPSDPSLRRAADAKKENNPSK